MFEFINCCNFNSQVVNPKFSLDSPENKKIRNKFNMH